MNNNEVPKIKKNNPVSIIVHSTNILGKNIAKTIAEQGGNVVLVDKWTPDSKKQIQELKKFGNVDFVNINSIENLMKKIEKIDYLFYIQSDFLLSNQIFESNDFLEESNNLNICLKYIQKHKTKFALITTILFNERLINAIQNVNYTKPSPYSAEELQKYSETLVAEYYDKSKINAKILRLGTILGKENNIHQYPNINQLFQDSVKNTSINIQGEGLDANYLIHIEDAIYGILKLTFSDDSNGEVISLSNNNEYTILSLAYKLLELNPNATEIKFVSEKDDGNQIYTEYIPAPNAEEYSWKQNHSLEESVLETLKEKYSENNKRFGEEEKDDVKKKSIHKKEVKKKEIRKEKEGKKERKKILNKINLKIGEINWVKNALYSTIIIILTYFLIYPVISITLGSYIIYSNTEKIANNYSELKTEDIDKRLRRINGNLKKISKQLDNLQWLFWVTQSSDLSEKSSTLIYALKTGSEGAIELNESIVPLRIYLDTYEPSIGKEEKVMEYSKLLQEMEDNSPRIENSIYKISTANNLIENMDDDVFPKVFKKKFDRLEKYNNTVEEKIISLQNISTFLPDLLGHNERQTYVIVLQDNKKLRSTGGEIKAYSIISIEGGQIRELKTKEIKNLDSDIAPEEISNALGINNWDISISNWEPNFQESANHIKSFLDIESIDGIITIDMNLISELLKEWDGIEIPNERETITYENIHQKNNDVFFNNLLNETLKKFFSLNAKEYSSISDVLIDSLNSKNILMSFNNYEAQEYITKKEWSGDINSRKNASAPFSIEWSWGPGPSNLFIDREEYITLQIIDENTVKYRYSVILKNNSTSQEYTSYTRIYVPEGAKINRTYGWKENKYDELEKRGFKILGGWFNIPIQDSKELSLEYTLENSDFLFEKNDGEIKMPIHIFKQPGTTKYDIIRLEVRHPNSWKLIEKDDFATELNMDQRYNLLWEIF